MAFMALVGSPVSYPKDILYWSKDLCVQFVLLIDCPISVTLLSLFPSGNAKIGPTTPKVVCRSLPHHSHTYTAQASGYPLPEIVPPC